MQGIGVGCVGFGLVAACLWRFLVWAEDRAPEGRDEWQTGYIEELTNASRALAILLPPLGLALVLGSLVLG